MSKNPCKGCKNASIKNVKYYKNMRFECYDCEKRKDHELELKKKTKFKEGDYIKSLDELIKRE